MDHFADRKSLILSEIRVRCGYVLWRELLLQFSTDSAINLNPVEENGFLSRKEIPAHHFSILVFCDPRSTSRNHGLFRNSHQNCLTDDVTIGQRVTKLMENILLYGISLVLTQKSDVDSEKPSLDGWCWIDSDMFLDFLARKSISLVI